MLTARFEVIYFTVLLVRFEDTLLAPPTQRVARDMSVVRLPRLYFCPANRYKSAQLIWSSYECPKSASSCFALFFGKLIGHMSHVAAYGAKSKLVWSLQHERRGYSNTNAIGMDNR